jgi:hypothetical protein
MFPRAIGRVKLLNGEQTVRTVKDLSHKTDWTRYKTGQNVFS